MQRRWITPGVAAKLMAVSQWTIKRYCHMGYLAYRRTPTGRYQIDRESLAPYLEPIQPRTATVQTAAEMYDNA